jgi:hypothetical protein
MPLGEHARRGHVGHGRLQFVLPAGDDVALTLLMSLKVAVDQDIVTGKRFFYIMRSKPTALTCSMAED